MAKIIAPEEVLLSNGIPVILQQYDGPVAATYWWIRTGSGDEAPKEAGFAHFLEHMLFKDAAAKETGRASTGQMARAIESLGGDINAYTSFDQTVYHVTCASHHWEKAIEAFGSMAKPQRFLKTDFEREREVILEELRKNEDSPGRQLFQRLFTLTFKKHPYGKPVIGFRKTLNAARVGDLEAFYRRNYVPAKMGLILVGPVADAGGKRRKAILAQLERKFGSKVLPRKAAGPAHSRPAEPAVRKGPPPFEVRPFDVKTPSVSLSFRAPELSHEDIPAYDLLAGILSSGELCRLYQRLFYQTSLVTEVSGGLYVPKDPGMFYIQAEMDNVSKVATACEEIFKEIRRLRDEGPTPEELSRVIVNIESERLYATQTADGVAGRVGFLKYVLDDLDYDRKYLDELRAVDSARIREIAHHYLTPDRMSGVVLVPNADKAYDAKAIAQNAESILGDVQVHPKTVASKPFGKGSAHPVELITLPSGIRVAYFERPQSHVFSIHSSVFGGLRMELADPQTGGHANWGTSYMMSLTWTKGTKSKSARDIAAIVEGRAAGVDGFSGRNTVGLQMTGLSRDWGELSALQSEVLLETNFPTDEVDHSRRVAEDSVRGIEDHSSQLCSKLFLETLFENHPYGKWATGSLETLPGVDSARLRKFHQAWVRPDRMVIAVSGSVKRAMLDQWLSELEARINASGWKKSAQGEALKLPDEPALKAPRWVERSLGREQAHILVGGIGTTILSEDRHALRLLQTILGGQSGRLFIELREKKSLAYSVAPMSFEGMEKGYVGTYIACAPQKRTEAIEGIRAVLEKMAKGGPTPAEMARAKELFLGQRAMGLQSDSSLSSHYGLETLYGIPLITEEQFMKKIRAITAKEIREVCSRYLVEPHMVTSVVG